MQFLTNEILAHIFAFLMGLAMLIYAILDGYDLGVGILSKFANDEEKDRMIASIGPFWDANETWLVLGVGILLTAFPQAHGEILGALYLPVAIMLIGLIFRGVAFDFRSKVHAPKKHFWNRAFFLGSLTTSLAQGYMLGSYIMGFENSFAAISFSFLIGILLSYAYCLIGASWLIFKCAGQLYDRAILWAKNSLKLAAIGIVIISIATPLTSLRIFDKWFLGSDFFFLLPIPFITFFLVAKLYLALSKPTKINHLEPFLLTVAIFVLCFIGLAYSFYPYIIPEKMLIIDATISSRQSMLIIFFGAIFVIPILLGYTIFVYRIFSGKASELRYD